MIKGFSLIELLIVLAITGIIAAFSYPSYQEYILRAHRTDGKLALLDLALRMEAYYAEHNTYRTATIGSGKSTDVLSRQESPDGWYTVSLTQLTDTTYTLLASPNHMQDTRCQSLTLTSSGIKGITADGPIAGISHCW